MNVNKNYNEFQFEISMKYQWKSIVNQKEICMKNQWKSIGNLVEISMKYKSESIGNPVEIQQKCYRNMNVQLKFH